MVFLFKVRDNICAIAISGSDGKVFLINDCFKLTTTTL